MVVGAALKRRAEGETEVDMVYIRYRPFQGSNTAGRHPFSSSHDDDSLSDKSQAKGF